MRKASRARSASVACTDEDEVRLKAGQPGLGEWRPLFFLDEHWVSTPLRLCSA